METFFNLSAKLFILKIFFKCLKFNFRKYLLRFYGMNGFKKIIAQRNIKIELAERYYSIKVFREYFTEWRLNIRAELSVRERKADEFYERLLLKHAYFNGIKRFKQHMQIGLAKAARFYKFNIKLKLFKVWCVYKRNEKEKFRAYELMIVEHNILRIKINYFKIWKEYPAEMKRQKEKQKRLDELRSKVKQLIPDYENPFSPPTSAALK